jgi:hypothetical protein
VYFQRTDDFERSYAEVKEQYGRKNLTDEDYRNIVSIAKKRSGLTEDRVTSFIHSKISAKAFLEAEDEDKPKPSETLLDIQKNSRRSISYYQGQVKSRGFNAVNGALNNIIDYNKDKDKALVQKLTKMQADLKTWVDKQREADPKFGEIDND